MLNKDGQRELAYIVTIDELKPIPNYDRVEHARVGGWWVIVKKDQFKVGDLAIYLEVDSKVPEKEPFMFLEKRNYKVKTLKMCKVISQGLLMAFEDFDWKDDKYNVGDFVTKELDITYYDPDDVKRKANSADKYKAMAQRRPDIFKKKWARWMMRRKWGRKVMFLFFGKKKDKKNGWPAWIKKTDEERCQNMPWLFPGGDEEFTVTEKIDGTSTTFTMKRNKRDKRDFYICSRNVVFDKPDKKCFYDTNVYVEMAEKYPIERCLNDVLDKYPNLDFVTIQGETYGEGIQKRDYHMKEHCFMAFNFIMGMIDKEGKIYSNRLNPVELQTVMLHYGIPSVPVICKHYIIPHTCEELLQFAGGESIVDGGMREGIVLRSWDGKRSFKAVDNEFLLKYH